MPSSDRLLFYDQHEGRWCVKLKQRTYGFHCGETFHLCLDGHMVAAQLEYHDGWYLIISRHRFNLHPKATYRVTI
jgi:hypothetical protein